MILKLLKITDILISPGKTHLGESLPLPESIWGVEIEKFSKAYPLSELKKTTTFTDKIGTYTVQITYHPESGLIEGINVATGKKLVFQNHWWFGWKEFHPETEIWKYKEE